MFINSFLYFLAAAFCFSAFCFSASIFFSVSSCSFNRPSTSSFVKMWIQVWPSFLVKWANSTVNQKCYIGSGNVNWFQPLSRTFQSKNLSLIYFWSDQKDSTFFPWKETIPRPFLTCIHLIQIGFFSFERSRICQKSHLSIVLLVKFSKEEPRKPALITENPTYPEFHLTGGYCTFKRKEIPTKQKKQNTNLFQMLVSAHPVFCWVLWQPTLMLRLDLLLLLCILVST